MSAQPVFADPAAAAAPPASPFLIEADLDAARCLRLAGSRREVGRQHGAALREPIARFLGDRVTRLEPLVSARRLHEFAPLIASHTREIERVLPELAEEIHGLAEGADIATEDAFLLQLRRELSGFQRIPARGDCTTFGRHAGGESIVAQTIDLNGDMAGELNVLEIAGAPGAARPAGVALLSFTGLVGYLGINDRGLAIGLNLVLGGQWRPGIPGYLAIRHLLERCASVDECLDTLQALPLASSRALTIADAARVVTVEYTPDALVVMEGAQHAHANHFLHPGLASDDALNPFARSSSLRRLEACRELLASLPAGADARACLDGLARAPIEVPPTGDVRRECTVASVAMFPARRALHVRGRPAAPPAAGA
ncbi:peptidase C45 [Burkholderia glumae]|uniref:C45 family autoproteolytic acyltransferase/hydolase n=1 Tax=Burkholderia glumae TaxID=337 RepID=UPI000F5E4F87|nr:C45 family peptidase [Burkholderia glumae]MCQ0029789.1 C45 family peptidase [Burkholderia glumae]MCQ0038572.1 C45 family peptidase [Burkholderia glumae]QJP71724.1 peptidase C45 [Burkholderia glumae]QJW77680.1 peptidase C45 [Burkholderia glumae]RQZ73511.1 peptidase C45 [Burkholderia glumae]